MKLETRMRPCLEGLDLLFHRSNASKVLMEQLGLSDLMRTVLRSRLSDAKAYSTSHRKVMTSRNSTGTQTQCVSFCVPI